MLIFYDFENDFAINAPLQPQHKSASGVATGTNTELPVVREQQSSIVVQGNAGMDHDQGIDMTLVTDIFKVFLVDPIIALLSSSLRSSLPSIKS